MYKVTCDDEFLLEVSVTVWKELSSSHIKKALADDVHYSVSSFTV